MKKQAIALSLPRPPMRAHAPLALPERAAPRRVLGAIAAAVPAALVLVLLGVIVALILWAERNNDITDC